MSSKYSPENTLCYLEYQDLVRRIDPRRLKFGGEKRLHGSKLVSNKRGRPNPLTGLLEPAYVDTGTYTVIGFTGIDPRVRAMDYYIHPGTVNSGDFVNAVTSALGKGFLLHGDILVVNKASIHQHQEAEGLFDFLWSNCGVLLFFLPAHRPELNPLEAFWKALVKSIKNDFRTMPMYLPQAASVVQAASGILNGVGHAETASYYRQSGYLPN
jgi:hypothetical protein